jgi:cytidylate kinase
MSLITITRGMGCGGEKIAAIVAEKLKVDLFDDKRLQEEAIKMGVPSDDLKGLDEKAPGYFDLLFGQNPEIYKDILESVIFGVAKKGEGVIIGHGSHFLLRDFNCALHVHLAASESFRVRQVMMDRGLEQDIAKKLIHKSDHNRRGFLRYAFHIDWNDISIYDLVINPEKIGIEGAVKLILEAAGSQTVKECSLTAMDSMNRLSLAKKIEAALAKNSISPLNYHVEVSENGVAMIIGFTYSKEEKELLVNSAKKVPGVTEVDARIAVISHRIA